MFLYKLHFSYIKVSNDLSAGYYKEKAKKGFKKAFERYQDLSEEKNKRENMVANNIKIFLSMKNKG